VTPVPHTTPGILQPDRLLVNLASARLGAAVLSANDEFFAPASNLLRPGPPEWRAGEYTDRGKWMDGWETRRRREPGQDECVIRLGAPGRVREVVVDTAHFRGNQPESCALDGLAVEGGDASLADGSWEALLERRTLDPDAVHRFEVEGSRRVTHVRLRIFPDGGVARLRVLGRVEPDWKRLAGLDSVDLAALTHGGLPVATSDASFGEPRNLLLPGEPENVGEGWETRRRRDAGHDWVVIALGHRGSVERLEISTRRFQGNCPAAASVDACDAAPALAVPPEDGWWPLLPRSELQPDRPHSYGGELATLGPVTHVRLNIFPDGGVARLRVIGRPLVER